LFAVHMKKKKGQILFHSLGGGGPKGGKGNRLNLTKDPRAGGSRGDEEKSRRTRCFAASHFGVELLAKAREGETKIKLGRRGKGRGNQTIIEKNNRREGVTKRVRKIEGCSIGERKADSSSASL